MAETKASEYENGPLPGFPEKGRTLAGRSQYTVYLGLQLSCSFSICRTPGTFTAT